MEYYVALILTVLGRLQTPAFIVAIICSIWGISKLNKGEISAARLLISIGCFLSAFICVFNLGVVILYIRSGQTGQILMPLFMAALWGWFARRDFRTLQALDGV